MPEGAVHVGYVGDPRWLRGPWGQVWNIEESSAKNARLHPREDAPHSGLHFFEGGWLPVRALALHLRFKQGSG